MALRFMNIDEPQIVFDPVAVPPPAAARVRSMLKELDLIRWTGRNRYGEPVEVDPDYLLDLMNRAEAGLRPHAMGLLSTAVVAGAAHG